MMTKFVNRLSEPPEAARTRQASRDGSDCFDFVGNGRLWPGFARGVSNKEIARALNLAESTVKVHVQSILRKLNLSSRVQAAIYAIEHKIDKEL